MITKKQFDILVCLFESQNDETQRSISKKTGMSVGSVNRIMRELNQAGLLNHYKLTEKGKEVLEKYRVKQAVILADAFYSRLLPITYNTPKAMVRIQGAGLIDKILMALKKAEIEKIYIVRGYLKEYFDTLKNKYPNLEFIDNPDYLISNSLTSLLQAKEYLNKAYVIEADFLLQNPDLVSRYQYMTSFYAYPVPSSHSWCFSLTENGNVTKGRIGGRNCYEMAGISYWNEEDGSRLKTDLESVFKEPAGKERDWKQVPLQILAKNYHINLNEIKKEDIDRIDTFEDLKKMDPSYDL